MEIRHLRHFLALYETKSYWPAAELCGLTPQALSKSIRRFEEALGVRLFDRDTRSVCPTLFAEEIALFARSIDAESNSLRRKLDSLLGTGTDQLAIGTGAAAATTLVGQAVVAVIQQRPNLAVNVLEGTYEGLMPRLLQGKLDIVVRIMTSDSVDRLIDSRVLKVEHYRVYARAGHPLAGLERVPLGRLAMLDTKFTKINFDQAADCGPAGTENQPLQLKFSPKFSSFVAAGYRVPLSNGRGALTLGADWTRKSSFYHSSCNPLPTKEDGYDLLNAHLGYETADRRWQVTAQVRNLGDEDYAAGQSFIPRLGFNSIYFNAPRTWAVSIRYTQD